MHSCVACFTKAINAFSNLQLHEGRENEEDKRSNLLHINTELEDGIQLSPARNGRACAWRTLPSSRFPVSRVNRLIRASDMNEFLFFKECLILLAKLIGKQIANYLNLNRKFSNLVARREEDPAVSSRLKSIRTLSVILQDTRWKDREDIKRARQEEVGVGT